MLDTTGSNEMLRLYTTDLLELERHFIEMLKDLPDHEDVRRYPDVQELVTRIQKTVEKNFNELQQGLDSLGGEKSSVLKHTMGMIAGAAMGIAAKVEGSEKCSKVLRNNLMALDAASLGSLLLYTTAAGFSNQAISEISERHFRDLASLASETRDLIPTQVVREFTDEGYSFNSQVGEEARRMSQHWMYPSASG